MSVKARVKSSKRTLFQRKARQGMVLGRERQIHEGLGKYDLGGLMNKKDCMKS
jgi:hypothetical protein